jgi:hypothetical protein
VLGAVTGIESTAVIDGTSLSGAMSQDRFAISLAGRRLAGPVLAAAGEGPSPWLPTVPQPLASAVSQAAELRLCPNSPQVCAHIVILAAQKAANRHK